MQMMGIGRRSCCERDIRFKRTFSIYRKYAWCFIKINIKPWLDTNLHREMWIDVNLHRVKQMTQIKCCDLLRTCEIRLNIAKCRFNGREKFVIHCESQCKDANRRELVPGDANWAMQLLQTWYIYLNRMFKKVKKKIKINLRGKFAWCVVKVNVKTQICIGWCEWWKLGNAVAMNTWYTPQTRLQCKLKNFSSSQKYA